jgi:hypothetical protein
VTAKVPPAFTDQLSGGIVVAWSPLPSFCVPSDGATLADGSVASCPVGESLPLRRYRVYYKLSDATDWRDMYVGGEQTTQLVTGLDKGRDYSFQVGA